MAVAIVRANGGKIIEIHPQRNSQLHQKDPPWKIRLQKRIERLRSDIATLEAFQRGDRSKYLKNRVKVIKKKHREHTHHNPDNSHLLEFIDTLKQKLSVYSQRMRRYTKSLKRKVENRDFLKSQKDFYRKMNEKNTEVNSLPEKSTFEETWSKIWSTESHFNANAPWLEQVRNAAAHITEMRTGQITLDILQKVVQKLQNWKCPGSDGLHNYWFKKFTCLHGKILNLINHYLNNPEEMSHFLCEGVTYMKPKTSDTTDPTKYRPITCLNSFYKVITSCLSMVIEKHCVANSILAECQKGCSKGSLGCKEQLLIDSVVMSQACKKKRNLFTCFIDYRKAYDMVPHDWLLYVLSLYRVNSTIVNFLKSIMGKWKTTIRVTSKNETMITKEINIKRGIFQGDSLSPYWFCLAMNPLSTLLEDLKLGFELRGTERLQIAHLAYMDDIKLYSGTMRGLKIQMKATEDFSRDINMELGIDKCKIQQIQKGKLTSELTYETVDGETITALEADELYKYLGIQQGNMIAHHQLKGILKTELTNRLKSVLKTSLNSRNLTAAINSYAIPIITFSMGILKWSTTDLEELERLVRVQMTRFGCHHPKSAIQRVTLPRQMGGRGIVKFTNLHAKQIIAMRKYFAEKAGTSLLHKVLVQADDNYTPLNLKQDMQVHQLSLQQEIDSWKQKALHGAYPAAVANPNVDQEMSYKWLSIGYLYPESEGFMIAIQDQVIPTKNYLKYIIKDPGVLTDECRMCGRDHETIQHIISGCSCLAPTDYKVRHDQVSHIIHSKLAKKHRLPQKVDAPYYQYHPEAVLENETHKLYWDRSILTDRTIQHNRPDITLWDKSAKKVWFIDVAVVNTSNMMTTYQTKIDKYRELVFAVKEQWRVSEVKTIPIVLSATGVIPKTLCRSLEELSLEKSIIIGLQKSVIISTCSLVRRFMGGHVGF